jgi:threonine/homoserine/homoserine lactone efflux protein
MNFFFKGIILGFSIAAPVGPIGVLCIRRTLEFGRWSGFISGLGAAAADVIYAIIAAFGLTVISNALLAGQFWLRLIGGIFLLYLGGKIFFTKQVNKANEVPRKKTLLQDFISTFFLTLTSPMTILSFLAIFAGLGLATTKGSYMSALMFIIGVFLGSTAWWILLSEGVTLFRKRVTQKVMLWINRIAGLLIASFGIAALLTAF